MWRNFHAFGVGQVVLVEFRKALNHAHRRQGRPEDVILGKQNFHQEPFASRVFRGLALFWRSGLFEEDQERPHRSTQRKGNDKGLGT